MLPPEEPKIYHILHVDRLSAVISDGCLFSDRIIRQRRPGGTSIGMGDVKDRRLVRPLQSQLGLLVGDCVPFYFCPRSVMLYVIHKKNHPQLGFRGGQDPIVHLEADLRETVEWAESVGRRWAFTSSNAASRHFRDYRSLANLDKLDWDAVYATRWQGRKEGKQAEFLVEQSVSWGLVRCVGVPSESMRDRARRAIGASGHQPAVEVRVGWYY